MSAKMKQWVALAAVGILAVMAAGWFLLISPKRSEAGQVRDEVASQNTTNNGLQGQLAMLKAQAKTLPQQQAKLAKVAAQIPDNPALPALIRTLSTAADDAGVELVSMSPGMPAPVAAPAAPVAQPALGTSTGTTGTAASKPAVTLSAPGAGAAGSTAGQLNAISLNINVVGGYFQIEQFFDRVEKLTRVTKVTGFTLAPGANPMKAQSDSQAAVVAADPGKVLSATVTANVYMALGRATAPVAVAPVK